MHQQQRVQYENQLVNIYSSRHEHNLQTIYLNILEKQFQYHENLYNKQQTILDSLNQQKYFSQILETLIDYRISLIDQTDEQINKILQYIKSIYENLKPSATETVEKKKSENFPLDFQLANPIDKVKSIENEFSKRFPFQISSNAFDSTTCFSFSHSTVHAFVDYVNKQNDDFRPKANDLSNALNQHVKNRLNEWAQLQQSINQNK